MLRHDLCFHGPMVPDNSVKGVVKWCLKGRPGTVAIPKPIAGALDLWVLACTVQAPVGVSARVGRPPAFAFVKTSANLGWSLPRGCLAVKIGPSIAWYCGEPVCPGSIRVVETMLCSMVLSEAEKTSGYSHLPLLPFGLRSAPKIYNAVADALEWYTSQQGTPHMMLIVQNNPLIHVVFLMARVLDWDWDDL